MDTSPTVTALTCALAFLARSQLEQRIERHQEVARLLVKEKKMPSALLALKKKKLAEKQMEDLGALQLNMETMVLWDGGAPRFEMFVHMR
jgi:hypothetical protein